MSSSSSRSNSLTSLNPMSGVVPDRRYCYRCKQILYPSDKACIIANSPFHTKCFNCVDCKNSIVGKEFYTVNGLDNTICKVCFVKKGQGSGRENSVQGQTQNQSRHRNGNSFGSSSSSENLQINQHNSNKSSTATTTNTSNNNNRYNNVNNNHNNKFKNNNLNNNRNFRYNNSNDIPDYTYNTYPGPKNRPNSLVRSNSSTNNNNNQYKNNYPINSQNNFYKNHLHSSSSNNFSTSNTTHNAKRYTTNPNKNTNKTNENSTRMELLYKHFNTLCNTCYKCKKPITPNSLIVKSFGRYYHQNCFICEYCKCNNLGKLSKYSFHLLFCKNFAKNFLL